MKNILKHKKELIIGIVFVLVIIVCLIFFFANNKNGKGSSSNTENNVIGGDVTFTEQDLIDTYGVSGENAINIVKEYYNSDNFEYSFSVTDDAMYIVTVKNSINGNTYKFKLNPSTKSYYSIDE